MGIENIIASLHHTIGSHTSDVNSVAFSKDGKLATCSGDKTVRIWDTPDFNEAPCSPLCGHIYYVHCCTFSPFGTLLATCSTDGKLIVWDVKTGKKTFSLQHESQSPIRVCRFSPNSAFIVSGSDDETVCLWEVSSRKLVRSFVGHEASVMGCCFSPDSHFIVSGSSNGDIRVWDAKYGHGKHLKHIIEGHDLGVTCCDFSPTFGSAGSTGGVVVHFLLATSGQDDLVKVWDFVSETGTANVSLTERFTLEGHQGSVSNCCFSADGRLLASGSIDKTVRLWDPIKGAPIHVIDGHTRYVTCCAFSSDGCYLASGSNDRSVMVWKIASDETIIKDLDTSPPVEPTAPLEGQARRDSPEKWSVDDVCKWVVELGLDQYADNFRTQHIDGTELMTLNHETLCIALGVDALGHRNKILRSRMKLVEHPIVQPREQGGVLDAGVPDEYLCPITREVMKDPVIASDGYTYERSAIASWIESGKDRSPMTNAILTSKDLTPNRSLKMLIQRYLNG